MLAPNVLRLADHMRGFLLNDPAVMQVISFASTVISPFNQMFHYGHPKYFGMPKNPQQAGNLWYLFLGGTAPGDMEHYISNTEAKETCIRVMLRDHTGETLSPRAARDRGFFAGPTPSGNPAYAKVDGGLHGGAGGSLCGGQRRAVPGRDDQYRAGAGLRVYLLHARCSGRCWPDCMFVFACVLANFTAFIYMYLFGIQLTIDTLPVISLAIGLGIDYGISTVSADSRRSDRRASTG